MITVRIPIPPQPFKRPRFNKGRGFNDAVYANYKLDVGYFMREKYHGKPLEGPLWVMAHFMFVKPKNSKNDWPCVRPDLDNFLKGVLDAGNGILWKDDAQICNIETKKTYCLSALTMLHLDKL